MPEGLHCYRCNATFTEEEVGNNWSLCPQCYLADTAVVDLQGEDKNMKNKKIVAILSTTILPLDGTYKVQTLQGDERQEVLGNLVGLKHFVGHPDTKTILEALGAVQAETKLFAGLSAGESVVCFPIKQGLSDRAEHGFTNPHQAIEEIEKLDVRILTRLE